MVVKFLESERESSFFVSGDNAGAVRVWKEDNGAVSLALYICRAWLMLWTSEWSLHALLPGHSQSVSALALLELPSVSGQDAGFIVVTGSSDGTLHSWIIAASGPGQFAFYRGCGLVAHWNWFSPTAGVQLEGQDPTRANAELLAVVSEYVDLTSHVWVLLTPRLGLILAIGSTENRLQLYTSPMSTAEISVSLQTTLRRTLLTPSGSSRKLSRSKATPTGYEPSPSSLLFPPTPPRAPRSNTTSSLEKSSSPPVRRTTTSDSGDSLDFLSPQLLFNPPRMDLTRWTSWRGRSRRSEEENCE
jgi:hypothetical protein